MTSVRQIEANRHNALRSTGPKTENGKQRSRRNALRHGFTAETVIEPLESRNEYRAFEAAILTEYLPQTPVEQELVRRLASLFWRLRRATSIETGLLRVQSEILQAFRSSRQKRVETREEGAACRCGETAPNPGKKTYSVTAFRPGVARPPRQIPRVTSRSATCGWRTSTTNSSIGSVGTRVACGARPYRHFLRCRRSSDDTLHNRQPHNGRPHLCCPSRLSAGFVPWQNLIRKTARRQKRAKGRVANPPNFHPDHFTQSRADSALAGSPGSHGP